MTLRGIVARLLPAVALPLMALSATAAVSAPQSGAATVRKAAGPVLLDCQHKAVVRPASFIIACADANSYLQKMTWQSWGAKSAKGTGTYTENTCTPNCAAGRYVSYTAKVTLSTVKVVKAKRYFGLLRVSYRSGAALKSFDFPLET